MDERDSKLEIRSIQLPCKVSGERTLKHAPISSPQTASVYVLKVGHDVSVRGARRLTAAPPGTDP